MKKHSANELKIHFLMCTMGGFVGAYALLLRGGNFGSASTGNLLECMIMIAECKPLDVIIRLGGGFLFALPFMVSKWMEKRTSINRHRLCLYGEILVMFLLALLPIDMNPVLALYPLFFITGFQWSVFSGTSQYNCSTIFISNNTRQCATALSEYLLENDSGQADKSWFYGRSILCYLGGGLVSAYLAHHFGPVASVAGILMPLLVLLFTKNFTSNIK